MFFDDILLYNPTWLKHLEHLKLDILEEKQFVANKKKCNFGQRQVEYLGHIIRRGRGGGYGSKQGEQRVTVATPRSIRELRGFLGLTGYYRL